MPSMIQNVSRVLCVSSLALLISMAACSDLGPDVGWPSSDGPSDPDETPDAPPPPTEPDYTDEELEAIASTDEVQANLYPFRDAPSPDRSLYVPMSDGVKIALDLYFPPGFDPNAARAPTVYAETWYSRAGEAIGMAIELYREAGFVVAIADPRGFGASFGSQSGYLTAAQRNDQREMFAWLGLQPWSTGDVTAAGISVSAMLAEAALASGAPNLKAGVVRATEFDQYAENLFPGGLPNPRMAGLIEEVLTMIRAEPCLADISICAQYPFTPVDGDESLGLMREALAEHSDGVSPAALEGVQYKDEYIGTNGFADVSPEGHVADMAKYAVPARVAVSWLDGATAEGALARFAALPNAPMQLSIAATTHLAGLDADPFSTFPFAPARTQPEVAFSQDVAFVKQVLAGHNVERKIDYYILGAGVWKSTQVWPPEGVRDAKLHFTQAGLTSKPAHEAGERAYAVDPAASSGTGMNRWSSQDNHPIYYGDRRFAKGARISFDGEPMKNDQELAGAPELCLAMRSDQTDGAVFAYLEDVAPDGRVTYLTEGELRLIHRKTRTGGCDAASGTQRSFTRADAAQIVPGELMQVEIALLPVAARIEKGHHLRVSLTGADEGTFPALSDEPANWSIAYGKGGSTISVPLRPWNRE
jgi:putative CocE/NonD family hydrolase